MNDLFLKKIEFSNFRIYGESYTFDILPSPGLTLIVGANGLGKTTFFDGIEWGLTGKVGRFDDAPIDGRRKERDPLTRLGAEEGTHRVSLQFNDGMPIDRGCGADPIMSQISDLLRKPSWPEIDDLHRYLSITHFLGQAYTQRFSVRKPKDQWEALRGPAGVDRINYVKERLGSQRTRNAFTKAISETAARLDKAEVELASWRELLAERNRLENLSLSEEALSAEAAIAAVSKIANEFIETFPELEWSSPTSSEGAESILSRLAVLSGNAEQRHQSELTQLHLNETLADEFKKHTAEAQAIEEHLTEINTEVEKARLQLFEVEKESKDFESLVVLASQRERDAHSRIGIISRCISAANQALSSLNELKEINAAFSTAGQALLDLEEVQAQLNRNLAASRSMIEQRRLNAERLAQTQVRIDLMRSLLAIDCEISRLTALASEEALANLRSNRLSVLKKNEEQALDGAAISAQLRLLDERQTAIAEAVATLAARISEQDIECPVCATNFSEGELLKLIKSRGTNPLPSASVLARRFAEHHIKVEQGREQLLSIERLIGDQSQLLGELAVQRATQNKIRQQLVNANGRVDGLIEDEISLASTLEHERRNLDEEIEASSSYDEIQNKLGSVTADMQAEAARRAGLARKRTELTAAAELARTILQQTPEFWDISSGWIVDIASIEAGATTLSITASNELVTAKENSDEAQAKVFTCKQRLLSLNSLLSESNGRLNNLVRLRQTITNSWLSSGMNGDPDRTKLEVRRVSLNGILLQINQLIDRQKKIILSYRRWLQDETFRERQNRIKIRVQNLNALDEASATSVLEEEILSANREIIKAQAAKNRMDKVVAEMQKQAGTYADGVLRPLNDTIKKFGRALMTWSDTSISYKAEHLATRSELKTSAVRMNPDGQVATLDINPNRFFSEGQLSALSVSALFAASTTFDWSRWKGLLLDDPLQHNDVIHASAFMDVVRQLISKLNYQIVMSTHDSAEAEFLIRKCQSAKIPFMVHDLAPCGENGLVSR